jgi:hypothetical protein
MEADSAGAFTLQISVVHPRNMHVLQKEEAA